MDEQPTSSKKVLAVAIIVIVLLLVAGGVIYWFMVQKGATGSGSHAFFGGGTSDSPRPTNPDGTPITGVDTSGGNSAVALEPLFKQLSTIPVAGATSIIKNGNLTVRYIAKEDGHIYDVGVLSGEQEQLTNTTIPHVYEAYWGDNGSSVVLRYLEQDPVTKLDTIKTYLGHLMLAGDGSGSSTDNLGTLTGTFLPDNITSVSVSPDGTTLFYLIPITNGVSGTTVVMSTGEAHEIFRNAFSEWTPEILNNGEVILTTKPSAQIPGFAYRYDPATKKFSRVVREKNGLTTLTDPTGTRMLYSQNIVGKTILNAYIPGGFGGDEGTVSSEEQIPVETLPEKCVWGNNNNYAYCAVYSSITSSQMPDDWYMGAVSLSDTFWLINTTDASIQLLADPKTSPEANAEFDVIDPFLAADTAHMVFINKKDDILWSFHIVTPEAVDTGANTADQTLTPEEMKDAAGSVGTQTPTVEPNTSSATGTSN